MKGISYGWGYLGAWIAARQCSRDPGRLRTLWRLEQTHLNGPVEPYLSQRVLAINPYIQLAFTEVELVKWSFPLIGSQVRCPLLAVLHYGLYLRHVMGYQCYCWCPLHCAAWCSNYSILTFLLSGLYSCSNTLCKDGVLIRSLAPRQILWVQDIWVCLSVYQRPYLLPLGTWYTDYIYFYRLWSWFGTKLGNWNFHVVRLFCLTESPMIQHWLMYRIKSYWMHASEHKKEWVCYKQMSCALENSALHLGTYVGFVNFLRK